MLIFEYSEMITDHIKLYADNKTFRPGENASGN